MKKPFYLLVALLVLSPPIVYTGAFFVHPRMRVGIVRGVNCEMKHAETSRDAFDLYPGCFQAAILPVTFNVTGALGPGDEAYPQIVIDIGRPAELRERYNVDIVLFVINASLMASQGEDRGIGGKADTKTGSGIVSISMFTDDTDYNRNRIKHITMHETFHLLGYLHDRWGRRCVMNTAENKEESRLNYFYEFQLPVRLWVFRLGLDRPFPQAAFVTAFANYTLWIPYFIGVELAIDRAYRKSGGYGGLPLNWFVFGLLGSAVLMGTTFDAIWFIAAPMCLLAFIHHYHYTLHKLKTEPLLKWTDDDVEEYASSKSRWRRFLAIYM